MIIVEEEESSYLLHLFKERHSNQTLTYPTLTTLHAVQENYFKLKDQHILQLTEAPHAQALIVYISKRTVTLTHALIFAMQAKTKTV